MKKPIFITLFTTASAGLLFGAQVDAQKVSEPASKAPNLAPPPISTVLVPGVAPGAQQVYVYEQKPLAGRQPLVTPEQAQNIIDKFKAAYPKLGSPRLLVYVNRQLVDENSGLKLIARTEKIDATRSKNSPDAPGTSTKKTARE